MEPILGIGWTVEMITVDRTSTVPLYQQIYHAVVGEIRSGALAQGDRLPATRKLAEQLGVGRNTVIGAYDQLLAEGFVTAHMGNGFLVNGLEDMETTMLEYEHTDVSDSDGSLLPGKSVPSAPEAPGIEFDFEHGVPSASFFPHKEWRRSVNVALDRIASGEGLLHQDPQGQPELREVMAKYLKQSRGVECSPSQVVVTSGFSYTLTFIAQMLRDRMSLLAAEDPLLDEVCRVFRRSDYAIDPIRLKPDGIDTDALDASDARLVYLTPTHHFLSGTLLSWEKRKHLLAWAESRDAFIIEDDYTVDARSLSLATPAFQSMDTGGRVIYTGTFSKSLSPGIRAAFMVLPEELLERFHDLFDRFSMAVSITDQLALVEFISSGSYDKQLRTIMTRNEQRSEFLMSAISYVFGTKVTVIGTGPGEHMLLDVHAGLDQEELLHRALDAGVRVCATRQYYLEEDPACSSHVLLGFGTMQVESYVEALLRLKNAWFGTGTVGTGGCGRFFVPA